MSATLTHLKANEEVLRQPRRALRRAQIDLLSGLHPPYLSGCIVNDVPSLENMRQQSVRGRDDRKSVIVVSPIARASPFEDFREAKPDVEDRTVTRG